jgi:hypothetical protein
LVPPTEHFATKLESKLLWVEHCNSLPWCSAVYILRELHVLDLLLPNSFQTRGFRLATCCLGLAPRSFGLLPYRSDGREPLNYPRSTFQSGVEQRIRYNASRNIAHIQQCPQILLEFFRAQVCIRRFVHVPEWVSRGERQTTPRTEVIMHSIEAAEAKLYRLFDTSGGKFEHELAVRSILCITLHVSVTRGVNTNV